MAAANAGALTNPNPDAPPTRFRDVLFGLQVKFTLLVVGLALTVGTIVGALTVDFSSTLVHRLHNDHCRQTAALLANKAGREYAAGADALRELARQSVRTEPLLFVSFMDEQGRPLAVQHKEGRNLRKQRTTGFTPITTIGTPLLVSDENALLTYLDVTYPVKAGQADSVEDQTDAGGLLGYVRIGVSLERTLAEVTATMELLSGIAVVIVAMTVPVGFLLVRRLVGPLRELAGTMSRFADGDLGARSQVRRTDEIGALANSYNLMADKLAQKHQEISELNAELEERVQQRTRQLRELAARDPLTGLYNRRHFNEDLARRFAEAKRYGTDLACMMIDLDNFKSVNDRYGHQIGDEMLILTAITITAELRSADVAARFGGDEFIILLPQTDAAKALVLGERFMSKFSDAVLHQFPELPVSVSVGIGSMADVRTEDADDLIRAADKALYDAKTRGKNTIAARQATA